MAIREEFFDSFVAVVNQGFEQLSGCDEPAAPDNESGINVPGFAEEIDGEFCLRKCTLDEFLVLEPVLVSALFPVGEILGVDSFARLADFVEDDVIKSGISRNRTGRRIPFREERHRGVDRVRDKLDWAEEFTVINLDRSKIAALERSQFSLR